MVKIVKEEKDGALIVRIAGSIEESTNFEQLIGPPARIMRVSTKDVPRINSVGVKNWIRYFTDARKAGTQLTFFECSTSIVEQMNMISNFACEGVIESIYVPFSCGNCRSELVGLFKTDDLRKMQMQMPDLKCSKCGGTATFDDIPEEYFGFLMR